MHKCHLLQTPLPRTYWEDNDDHELLQNKAEKRGLGAHRREKERTIFRFLRLFVRPSADSVVALA